MLLKGDCLNLIPQFVGPESVDMIFADLPYGTTQCEWDVKIPMDNHINGKEYDEYMWIQYIQGVPFAEANTRFFEECARGLWDHYKRVLKPNGVILLFAQTPFDKVLGASNPSMLKYEWIWEKSNATGHLNAKRMPMKAHENILVFYNNPPTYNPQKTQGHKPANFRTKKDNTEGDNYGNNKGNTIGGNTDRYPRSVLKFKSDTQKSKLHPTQKPLALVKYFIETYTNVGDVVMDNVMGSGTTGVGCAELDREFIGMEKGPGMFETAANRILGTKILLE